MMYFTLGAATLDSTSLTESLREAGSRPSILDQTRVAAI